MMKLCIVAGARPNFIKIAPIISAINKFNNSINLSREMRPAPCSVEATTSGSLFHRDPINYILVHTGQHYDSKMSEIFFDDLGIPNPDINLEVGSASHAVQTAEIMRGFEKVCLEKTPTHVLVVGDVNSTIACALVASKLGIKVIHVEAGLRSFDRSMPEEINRVLTDAISDLLFTTEESANENLEKEGIPKEKVNFVGNVMIDTLLLHKKKAEKSDILMKLGFTGMGNKGSKDEVDPYSVLTLHRPSNVDAEDAFRDIVQGLSEIARSLPIIFPIHPRTLNQIKEFGLEGYFKWYSANGSKFRKEDGIIHCIDPLGYLDFLKLMSNAKLVLTDSGGIQEETTILGVPCVTIRENTERPVTVKFGTNMIAGVKKENIVKVAFSQLNKRVLPSAPPLWDGKAAERILEVLLKERK
jgi:UDP-N-acetylglucosamine 2-epimerase (non-hydrolysing)